MTLFHSIRTRLTLWYTALLGAALLGFGATAYLLTRSILLNNLDRSLRNEVAWVNEFIEPKARKVRLKRAALLELQELKRAATALSPVDSADVATVETDQIWNQIYQHTLLSPRRQFIQILDRNGDLLYRSPSLENQTIPFADIPYRTINIVTIRDEQNRELRLASTQNDFVKIVVAYPLADLTEALGDIFSNFGTMAPLALLVSIIGGWFLAHKSLKPVAALTTSARAITARNLSQRLPRPKVDDELGRLTETINDMIGRLQESFTQIQQFSADASHELRTPLTIMRGEIEVALRSKRLTKSTRELLISLHDELIRLSSIVESLMTLVKSESGRLAFRFDNVELHRMIGEILEDAQILAGRKEIHIIAEQIEPVTIRGDAVRLRQLFLNLVENAIKYTPNEGTVSMSLRQVNGNAVFHVSDTGIGIPKKDLKKIFDRFYRVKQDGIPDAGGSGLGLAIARWIAQAHHGTIEVKSQPRKGSTFTVTLPLS